MLTECPECHLQVSDKAITCPHCGYPLVSDIKRAYTKPTKRAHRKLPNGFGSITEIKGRYLRNPFLARVCVGKTETGRPILRNLKPKAYFKTYNEAYSALVEHHKTPYDDIIDTTVEDLYKKWSKEYFQDVSISTARATTSCWNKCSDLYKYKVSDVKAVDLRNIIDKEPSAGMKKRMKTMFDHLFDYAMGCEIVNKNVSKTFKLSKSVQSNIDNIKNPHKSLTVKEINRLWNNLEAPLVDIMLIGCYTGMRPREILNIKTKDVHLDEDYLIGGSKTNAGKNRIIPIHEKIKELIFKRMNNSEYLFTQDGKRIEYWTLQRRTEDILPDHRPHDFRKTFITYAKKSGMNDEAIKRIVGHELDVTEGIYTERSLEWLQNEMNKLSIQ